MGTLLTMSACSLQLWNKNMFVDTFLGEVILEGRTLVDQQEVKLPLYDRKDLTQRKPGYLHIRITVNTNLQGI